MNKMFSLMCSLFEMCCVLMFSMCVSLVVPVALSQLFGELFVPIIFTQLFLCLEVVYCSLCFEVTPRTGGS